MSQSSKSRKKRETKPPISRLNPDAEAMAVHKRTILGKFKATYGVHHERGSEVKPRFLHGSFGKHCAELANEALKGARITFIPHRADLKGGKAKNVLEIMSVFIDIDDDLDSQLRRLMKSKYPPDLVLRTSEGRGLVMWLVKGCSLKDFSRVQAALAAEFGGDPSRTSPASTVRMGGTFNWKGDGEPYQVEVVNATEKSKRKDVWKLCAALGVVVPEPLHDPTPSLQVPADDVPLEKVKEALACIPVAQIVERGMWLKLMMAVHAEFPGPDGFQVYRDYCAGASKFDQSDQEKTWKSLTPDGGVTIRTLFDLAAKHGWQDEPGVQGHANAFTVLDSFAAAVTNRLRYDLGRKCWLIWVHPVWVSDLALVEQLARNAIEKLATELDESGDKAARELARSMRSMAAVRSMLASATTHVNLTATSDKFDANPNLLAVKNGVIDLMSGEFRLATPLDMLVVQANVEYDPGAEAPKFKEFIAFFTVGRKGLEKYLQRALGYMLYGHGKEQKAFILLGDTENGKGVLSRLMEFVLGKYVVSIAPNLLTKAYSGNPNSPSPALMALRGARMFLCGEGQEGKPFDAAFFKQLSGNDTFTARDQYAAQGEFRPVGKLWLSTNELPDVDRQQKAIWRRLDIVPCDGKVKEVNPHLGDELELEAAGVLNWLIKGALAYKAKGLGTCEEVEQAKRAAKASSDSVGSWLAEECVEGSKRAVRAAEAHASYSRFIRKNGRVPLSIQRFAKAMAKKGFPKKKGSQNNRYVGIGLKSE